jgi:hypothetical protein
MMLVWSFAAIVIATVEGLTHNLTVYRITPRNYSGLVNLDTGDAAGDAFFGLYEKAAPVLCSQGSAGVNQLLCDNDPLLQIPGFNVYTQTVIEADTRFGVYALCNPEKSAPHDFYCAERHEAGCWYEDPEHPEWADDFADVCNKTDCHCDIITSHAVGMEYPHIGFVNPTNTPAQCDISFYQLEGYENFNRYSIINTTNGVDLGTCCSLCTERNTESKTECGGYSFTPAKASLETGTGTCVLHRTASFFDVKRSKDATVGLFTGLGVQSFVQHAIGKLSNLFNGIWYSTQAPGQCVHPGEVLGKDCWWRVINQTAQVNASCVNGAMINKAVNERPECFKGCPEPENELSECWVACLFETLVGNKSAVPPVPEISPDVLIDVFEKSFQTCTQVPDCPDPCLPPCWAVPKGDPCDPKAQSYF